MKLRLQHSSLLIRILLVTALTVAVPRIASADLASTKTWSQNWGGTYEYPTGSGLYWTHNQSSPCWLISDPSNFNTWLLSAKGTLGNYNIVVFSAPTASSTIPYNSFVDANLGVVSFWEDSDDMKALFPAGYALFIGLAQRVGGTAISNPTFHGVGTSVLAANVNDFDSYGTTFYMATDDYYFDGVHNYVGKCNNGTWVNMEFGVGCSSCVGPHASDVSVNSAGTVVTVQGNFQYGYTFTPPDYQVMCTTWGLLYFHVTGATTGNWSNSP